ncbi:MAG TPA: SRPBCC domain-containing protein [Acidimicrobiia bacterium]|nr:SRPBCC domain-containing protein [Acidimicrobiia bacterium]
MDPLPKVERSLSLDLAPPELWQHLVSGELASMWMGGTMTIEPRLNGRVSLAMEGSPPVFGAVEEIDKGRSIAWSWRTADGEPTQVVLRIDPNGEGSQLHVSEELLNYEIVIIPPVLG